MTHNLLAFPLPLLSPTDSGVELNLNHGHEKCQHLQHLKVKKKRHIFTFSECRSLNIYTGIYTNLIKWWTHNLIILETFENSLIFFLIIFVFLESKSYSYTHALPRESNGILHNLSASSFSNKWYLISVDGSVKIQCIR